VLVNPITGPFWYFGELWVGAVLTSHPIPSWPELAQLDGWGWWDLFVGLLGPFGLGAATTMAIAFPVAYATVYAVLSRWRKTPPPAQAVSDPDASG
jgi:hypothetical protein